MSGITMDTVDRFQGSERDCVIVSCVRTSPSSSSSTLGGFANGDSFLTNPNRFNVMLTRARRGLVVIGSGKVLSGLGQDCYAAPGAEWWAYMKRLNAIYSVEEIMGVLDGGGEDGGEGHVARPEWVVTLPSSRGGDPPVKEPGGGDEDASSCPPDMVELVNDHLDAEPPTEATALALYEQLLAQNQRCRIVKQNVVKTGVKICGKYDVVVDVKCFKRGGHAWVRGNVYRTNGIVGEPVELEEKKCCFSAAEVSKMRKNVVEETRTTS